VDSIIRGTHTHRARERERERERGVQAAQKEERERERERERGVKAAQKEERERERRTRTGRMVELVKDGSTGMEKVVLREPGGATAQVHLYGGHVTSWKNEKGEELLFLSSKAIFKPPKAIRGGIPICFPQFGTFGSLEQHGFARNRFWVIDPNPPPPPTALTGGNNGNGTSSNNNNNNSSSSKQQPFVDLILKHGEDEHKIWPHSFELCLRVVLGLGGDLTLITRVRNTDSKNFTFTFALHTYLSVSDVSEVRIEGLETLDYLDNLKDRERFTEQGNAITFDAEVDRIYVGTPTKIAIIDHEKKRTFVLKKEGLPDAVVWNPWEKKARAMVDFGDEEYKHMLCVEAAAVEKPITLKPGEEWRGRQELSAVPSSYFSGQLDPCKVLQG
jgi:glucose-6-phosphate 1-epimerase